MSQIIQLGQKQPSFQDMQKLIKRQFNEKMELAKALEHTTALNEAAANEINVLFKKLKEFMTEAAINRLFDDA